MAKVFVTPEQFSMVKFDNDRIVELVHAIERDERAPDPANLDDPG